jgi:TLP18.3/Psb32/MOLO-1 phosphatase superfamily protein
MRSSWIVIFLFAVCGQAMGALPEGRVSRRISSIKGSTVSLFHDRITFEVSPDAYFSRPFTDLEHLSVGMLVAATIKMNGPKLVAQQILGDPGLTKDYEAKIIGPPQSKSDTSVKVLGMTVDIPPGTPILGEGNDEKFAKIPDDYRVNIYLAEKSGRVVATRVYVARLVRSLRADLRYFGTILSIDGDRWRMKTDDNETITFIVDKQTMLANKVSKGDRVVVLAENTGTRLMAAFVQAEAPPKEVPAPKSHVTDTAKFFSEPQLKQLAATTEQVAKTGGGEIFVYITDAIDTEPNQVVKKWKIPKTPGLVVIFVLLDDHVVAFASDLPEAVTNHVRDTVIYPAFQKSDFLGGLTAAVEAFGKLQRLPVGR